MSNDIREMCIINTVCESDVCFQDSAFSGQFFDGGMSAFGQTDGKLMSLLYVY